MARTATENRGRIGQGKGLNRAKGAKKGPVEGWVGGWGRQVSLSLKIEITSAHFALET